MTTAMNNSLSIAVNFKDDKKRQAFTDAMEMLQRDADAMAAFEQATNLKEAYEALKKYCQLSFDEYEKLCNAYMEQLKESAAKLVEDRELNEDELDMVAGGWSWSSFWKGVATVALCAAIVVAGAATCGAVAAGVAAVASVAMGVSVISGAAAGVAALGGAAIGGFLTGVALTNSNSPFQYQKLHIG